MNDELQRHTIERLLLTVPEAAAALALSPALVWRLVQRKEIESIKIGSARRIPRAALIDYIHSVRESESSHE
jgi:excisionase family DNA binding protein